MKERKVMRFSLTVISLIASFFILSLSVFGALGVIELAKDTEYLLLIGLFVGMIFWHRDRLLGAIKPDVRDSFLYRPKKGKNKGKPKPPRGGSGER